MNQGVSQRPFPRSTQNFSHLMKGDSLTAVVMAAAEQTRLTGQIRCLHQGINRSCRTILRDMLASSRDGVHGAQGRAQALDDLAKKLEDCIRLDEQYRART
jgi:hypothetical protein